MFFGGFGHILTNFLAIGQNLLSLPGLEAVTQGEHVGIRPDTGVAEQVPSASNRFATLQNFDAFAFAVLLDVACCTNARQTGADNQYVYVWIVHCFVPVV